jgi:hypothetical protein
MPLGCLHGWFQFLSAKKIIARSHWFRNHRHVIRKKMLQARACSRLGSEIIIIIIMAQHFETETSRSVGSTTKMRANINFELASGRSSLVL